MTMKDNIISQAFDRYVRERDRYIKLTRLIEEICVEYFVEKSSFRVNITARTKSPSSFKKKLLRFKDLNEKQDWTTVDNVFDGISDFSGVRIAAYSSADLANIEEGLKNIFLMQDHQIDRKDRQNSHPNSHLFYKATHCQVALPEKYLDGDNANLRDLSCEVQVCSMMSHVWNEIEHDIGYKPIGKLGDNEKRILKSLGELVRNGDLIIENLFQENSKRIEEDDRITDPNHLLELLKKWFAIKKVTFRDTISDLFEILMKLNINTASKLKSAIGVMEDSDEVATAENLWSKTQAEIKKYNKFLDDSELPQYKLSYSNSSDPALFLILKNRYEEILENFPAGRGMGRPTRIRSLAARYKEFRHK